MKYEQNKPGDEVVLPSTLVTQEYGGDPRVVSTLSPEVLASELREAKAVADRMNKRVVNENSDNGYKPDSTGLGSMSDQAAMDW